jgi:hypothetical protein
MHPRRDDRVMSGASALTRGAADAVSKVTFALLATTDGPPVFAMSSAGAPLAALAGGALGRRFWFWQGASGRRYICSIFPFEAADAVESLPHYTQAVVAAVAVRAGGRRVRFVTDIDEAPDRFWAKMRDIRGIAEFHVHLLAGTAAQRQTVCADLSAFHGCPWRRDQAPQLVTGHC